MNARVVNRADPGPEDSTEPTLPVLYFGFISETLVYSQMALQRKVKGHLTSNTAY